MIPEQVLSFVRASVFSSIKRRNWTGEALRFCLALRLSEQERVENLGMSWNPLEPLLANPGTEGRENP